MVNILSKSPQRTSSLWSSETNSRLPGREGSNAMKNQFPFKLHQMLEASEKQNFTKIISWLPRQDSFKVHRPHEFESQILPRFFNQTKYKSFQKQLNIWGFVRLTKGFEKGGYRHSLFIRGRKSLCEEMNRRRKGPNMSPGPTTNAIPITKPNANYTQLTVLRRPKLFRQPRHSPSTVQNLHILYHVNYNCSSTSETLVSSFKKESQNQVFDQVGSAATKVSRNELPRAFIESAGAVSCESTKDTNYLDSLIDDFFEDETKNFLQDQGSFHRTQSFEGKQYSPLSMV